MRRPLWSVLSAGIAAIAAMTAGCQASACAGSGCQGTLDTTKVQNATKSLIAAQTGAQIRSVSCPRAIPAKQGASFTCTATGADLTTATILLTQRDSKGNVHISAPSLLQTGQIASTIATRLSAQGKRAVSVRCPDLIRIRRGTGMTLTCTATDAAAAPRTVLVTLTDAKGAFRYRVQ